MTENLKFELNGQSVNGLHYEDRHDPGTKSMSKPNVIINGVRYVPATEAAPSLDAIARGLIRRWWGIDYPAEELHRLMSEDYLHVYVNDRGEGEAMATVLGDIAEELAAVGKEAPHP